MSASESGSALNGWSNFFAEVTALLNEAERQYGIANRNYTEYVLERLEMVLSTCSYIKHRISTVSSVSELQGFVITLNELCDCIRFIYRRRLEYEEILDIQTIHSNSLVSYHACTATTTSGAGRPRFTIDKVQLEYLSSNGFKWTEVAVLLGVSRMPLSDALILH